MKVVMCEKPSMAREIANVLGATQKNDGYLEGNGYAVTWAFGHLFTLASPETYDLRFQSWNTDILPIIPKEFKLAPVTENGAPKQFSAIKKLLNTAKLVINAGDAGREGELIQRYILWMAGYRGEVKRFWISSTTEKAIREGFENLLPGSAKDNLYYAGKARAEADWLVGMNATRALTGFTGSQKALSLGRVQTPVLAMICQRHLEHYNFVPVPFFVPKLTLTKDGIPFKVTYKGDMILIKAEAEQILNKVQTNILCSNSKKEEKKDLQPLLFNLTTLQSTANRKFGYTAQKTLDLMQSLYETHKVLSYPRTDSKYLSEDIYETLPELFSVVKKFYDYGKFIDPLNLQKLPKRCVDDKKVSDHHAIIPTGQAPSNLSSDEKNIFDLVCKRFIAGFSDVCIKSVTNYEFTEGSLIFTVRGVIILSEGWRAVQAEEKDEEESTEEEDQQKLPEVNTNEKVPVSEKLIDSKKTQKPALYSEASILEAMVTCGKTIEDEELKDAMKGQGIGTPATRANIIEKLINTKYVERGNKKLTATELGLSLYKQIKDLDLASPILTGKWEYKLSQIEEGTLAAVTFSQEIKEYTESLVNSIKELADSIEIDKVICPKCKQGQIIQGKFAYGCNRYREGCDFRINFVESGKKVTWTEAKRRIATGEVSLETPVKQTEDVGEYQGKMIRFGANGKFGPYLTFNDNFINLPKDTQKPSLDAAIQFIKDDIAGQKEKKAKEADAVVHTIGTKFKVMDLEKGFYLSDGTTSAPLKFLLSKHKGEPIEFFKKLDEKECKKIISDFIKWKKTKDSKN